MLKKILIIYCLLVATSAFADEAADKAEFNIAYQEYLERVEASKDIDAAIKSAERVYKLAPRVYGKQSEEYAIVTYNLADLYDVKGGDQNNMDEKTALKYFRNYFKIIDKIDIPHDVNYIEKYLRYTTTSHNVNGIKTSKRLETNILKIADEINIRDDIKADVYTKLASLKLRTLQFHSAVNYLQEAHRLYIAALGKDHIEVANTLYLLGQIESSNNNLSIATEHYKEALRIFELEFKNEDDLTIPIHALMVNLYEILDRSDDATKHVTNITVAAEDYGKNVVPIYRAPLVIPEDIPDRTKSYEVTLDFTVDKVGRAKDITIKESDNPVLNENSITSLKKFRFTPSVLDGELIEQENVALTMHYFIFKNTQSQLTGNINQNPNYYNRPYYINPGANGQQ